MVLKDSFYKTLIFTRGVAQRPIDGDAFVDVIN